MTFNAKNQTPPTHGLAEREGLQLDWKRNAFQLAVIVAMSLAGALIGLWTTDDRPDLAAMIGGFVGLVLGAFVSGLILMLYDYPFKQVVIPSTRMTGLDHLLWQ